MESQGQLAAAAELNNKALELDPKLTQAHVTLISAYGRLGDVKKAEEHFRMAIAQNPNAADAHYNFGVLCYATNRKREAQQALSLSDQKGAPPKDQIQSLIGAIRAGSVPPKDDFKL